MMWLIIAQIRDALHLKWSVFNEWKHHRVNRKVSQQDVDRISSDLKDSTGWMNKEHKKWPWTWYLENHCNFYCLILFLTFNKMFDTTSFSAFLFYIFFLKKEKGSIGSLSFPFSAVSEGDQAILLWITSHPNLTVSKVSLVCLRDIGNLSIIVRLREDANRLARVEADIISLVLNTSTAQNCQLRMNPNVMAMQSERDCIE